MKAPTDGVSTLRTVAAEVALSPSRLSRMLADEVGFPFRRYVLWMRLRRAAVAVLGGADMTTAAAAAGFSDSAHFSRVFRSTFGLTPSQVPPTATAPSALLSTTAILDVEHPESSN